MLAVHIAIHQPITPPELELVDQMSIARWRIRRFVAAETDLIDSEMVRNREKVNKEFAPTDSGVHLAMAIRSLADESRALSLMSRYESRLQRVHDKAYATLREHPEHTAQASAQGRTRVIRPIARPRPAARRIAHPAARRSRYSPKRQRGGLRRNHNIAKRTQRSPGLFAWHSPLPSGPGRAKRKFGGS
jgi:hypothetical protein